MALTAQEIETALNSASIVEYHTLTAPRLRVRARFNRLGSEGRWTCQIEGGVKSSETISAAAAHMHFRAADMRLVRSVAA